MENLIEERSTTHGDFIQGATTFSQFMKPVAQAWLDGKIDDVQFYGLTMANAKQVRILNGNSHFADHWVDGANYFKLGGRLNLAEDTDDEIPVIDMKIYPKGE